MSTATTIEWTDATWNPVRGCAIVSKGCTNCYAMKQAHRFSGPGRAYEGLTRLTNGGPVWTGKVRLVHDQLDAPLHWKKPRRIFVNSMSDLFHEDVDAVFIGSVLGIAAACPQHTFQVLTKRPERMAGLLRSRAFLEAYGSTVGMYTDEIIQWPAPNVWLGVSGEDQAAADERIPLLLQTPAAVRWISAEPLLGPVVLRRFLGARLPAPYPFLVSATDPAPRGLDWVVAGGESGPGARPMHPAWARSLRDQCADVGVPFFFKQWGDWAPNCLCASPRPHREIRRPEPGPMGVMFHCGKHSAGRLLDGRTHNEYPA